MPYSIRIYGDPVLRQKAQPVTSFDRTLAEIAEAMIAAMRAARGVGLAAQQVGLTLDLCVIEIPPGEGEGPLPPMPLVLVNPRLAEQEGETCAEEGCLSFPGIVGPVRRSAAVRVVYQDLNGRSQEVRLQGLAARAVQHEMDHLAGVLLIDHFSTARRTMLRPTLRRLKAQAVSPA